MKKKTRQLVYEKYDGHCAYCGIDLPERWHVDHLEPVKRCLTTGKMTLPENDNLSNLMPSCPSCNMDKSSIPLEKWRELIANKVTILNRDVNAYKFAKRYGLVCEIDIPVIFYFEKCEMSKNKEPISTISIFDLVDDVDKFIDEWYDYHNENLKDDCGE